MNNIFPSAWKIAEVIPIPKNGDHEQPDNNIPFSLYYQFFPKYAGST
jgi:hypothetical protein